MSERVIDSEPKATPDFDWAAFERHLRDLMLSYDRVVVPDWALLTQGFGSIIGELVESGALVPSLREAPSFRDALAGDVESDENIIIAQNWDELHRAFVEAWGDFRAEMRSPPQQPSLFGASNAE